MKIHNTYTDKNGDEQPLIQGTDEWHDLRAGIPTASEFSKVLTAKTFALSKSHIPYMCKLVKESIFPTYSEDDQFVSEAMAHGILFEPVARKFYTKLTGRDVEEVGFCTMDVGIGGFSPDGLVKLGGEYERGLEIKCPQPATHIRWMYDGVLPDAHKQQCHVSMAMSGLDRWDFLSYHPDMAHLLVTVERDEYTEKVETALEEFTLKYAEFRKQILPKLKTK